MRGPAEGGCRPLSRCGGTHRLGFSSQRRVRSLAARQIECLFPAIRECPLGGDDCKIDLACEPTALCGPLTSQGCQEGQHALQILIQFRDLVPKSRQPDSLTHLLELLVRSYPGRLEGWDQDSETQRTVQPLTNRKPAPAVVALHHVGSSTRRSNPENSNCVWSRRALKNSRWL